LGDSSAAMKSQFAGAWPGPYWRAYGPNFVPIPLNRGMDFCDAAQNLVTPDVYIPATVIAADHPRDDADRGFPVPQVSLHHGRLNFPDTPAEPGRGGECLASRDAVRLLQLMGVLGSLRNDARAWRQELLKSLMEALPAASAAAFVLGGWNGEDVPVVVSEFDAGFSSEAQRAAFVREFEAAAFGDPFSRVVLQRFAAQHSRR